jgi:hypothetical protein
MEKTPGIEKLTYENVSNERRSLFRQPGLKAKIMDEIMTTMSWRRKRTRDNVVKAVKQGREIEDKAMLSTKELKQRIRTVAGGDRSKSIECTLILRSLNNNRNSFRIILQNESRPNGLCSPP